MILSDENFEKVEKLLEYVVNDLWTPHPDELERGTDYSDTPGVKAIFESYADLETEDEDGNYVYEEGGNRNMHCYAIFIHKDSKSGEFPEHDTAYNMIIHRIKEEICVYAWYDVENDSWEFVNVWDNDSEMDEDVLMDVVDYLLETYYPDEDENENTELVQNDVTAWPFGKK